MTVRFRTWKWSLVAMAATASGLAQTSSRPADTAAGTAARVAPTPSAVTANVTQSPETTKNNVGYVKGANVYIRSGFSTNYYPVIKLNTGDAVTIAGEEFGWLKIDPPAGTHSLVEKSYVTKTDDKTGVLNDNRWVFAGSDLDKSRYAKQVQLAKGTKVQIVGETPEGDFYQIVPPAGAHLWIKADLVDRTGKAAVAGTTNKTPSLEQIPPGQLKIDESKVQDLSVKLANKERPSKSKPIATHPAADPKQQEIENANAMAMDAIEAEIQAESKKPIGERNYKPVIARLQPLADQTTDEISAIYAKTRIRQLAGQLELAGAVDELAKLQEDAIALANDEARRREGIRVKPAVPGDEIVVKGEIMVSGVYDGTGMRPKRWRVVDPQDKRTLAFIEVPPNSPIDPVQYYGSYVGIKASNLQVLPSTSPPLTLYTVQEIVTLDPATQSEKAGESAVLASPTSPSVDVPTSEPAGTTTAPAAPEK